jgi:hypothetical protein
MWAFNVVRRLLELAPPERPVTRDWLEGAELDAALWSTLGYEHHLIKCHVMSGGFVPALDAQFASGVVFTLRDPLACLASCIERFVNREPHNWTFETALGWIERGLQLGHQLAGRPDVVFVDMNRDGEAASLERIVEFMGVPLAPDAIEAVREQFTFAQMRERSARIAEQPPEALMRGLNDPDTFMFANHVDKGAGRDWRGELTSEQIAVATERFAPYADLTAWGASTPRLRWDTDPGSHGAARSALLRAS